jgi:integrase
MVSVIRRKQGGRNGWRIRFVFRGRRLEVYLAGVRKSVAETAGRHIADLAKAKEKNLAADLTDVAWAEGTIGSLRERLADFGLVSRLKSASNECKSTLDTFVQAYIDGRTDVKATTRTNYGQTKRLLVEYFGVTKSIESITAADGDRWRCWMLEKKLAASSVSKHVKRARTIFDHAMKDRLVSGNSFKEVRAGAETNPARQAYIDAVDAQKIMDNCPDADWRVIFSLARWGGLRCPSEILTLKWDDINWDQGKIRIDAPKTGLRFCPLFPELRAVLEEAFELADEGSVRCVTRYSPQQKNLRTQLERIIQKAGLTPWPKLFNNLRASRRTELQEIYPSHVVDAWLGHSTKVAEAHYLQVTPEHWDRASGYHTGYHTSTRQQPATGHRETKKPQQNTSFAGVGWLLHNGEVTPMGAELLAILQSSWSEFCQGTTMGTTPDSVTNGLLAFIESEFDRASALPSG